MPTPSTHVHGESKTSREIVFSQVVAGLVLSSRIRAHQGRSEQDEIGASKVDSTGTNGTTRGVAS